jgi:uncharacterized membrane-anchored protein YitT (DUF2179 family)
LDLFILTFKTNLVRVDLAYHLNLIIRFQTGSRPHELVLNIPMFILGWRLLGRKVFVYTVVGTVSVSVFLKIFQIYEVNIHIQDDLFLAALFAGVFVGIGLGIIFRYGGTTGGVDIIARLAQKYIGWSMGKTMFIFDAVVILLSWLTFLDARSMMYTLVAVFIGARVIDFVQEGLCSTELYHF